MEPISDQTATVKTDHPAEPVPMLALGDNLPIGAIYQSVREKSGTWRFVYLSSGIERLSGLPAEAILENPALFYDRIIASDRANLASAVESSAQTMEPLNVIVRFDHPDGITRWLNLAAAPRRLPGGQVIWDGIQLDITEQKRAEDVMATRLRLMQFAATHSTKELLRATLDEAERLTGSSIGFYHFLAPDQITLTLQSWSTNTLKSMCSAEGEGFHYNIDQAGVWVDCIHQRQPVIHNDYPNLPHRKGMPDGHAPVSRELVIPIMRDDLIVSILGVGNKNYDYDNRDVEIVSLLADLSWDIVERQMARAIEREQHALAEALVKSAEAINQTLKLQKVFKRILQALENVVPHSGANIMLINQQDATVQVTQYSQGYLENDIMAPSVHVPRQLVNLPHLQRMIDRQQPLLIKDTASFPGWWPSKTATPIASYLGAPIVIGDEVIGFINLDSVTRNFFTKAHSQRLQAFAHHAAIAIQNARLHDRLQQQLEQLQKAQNRLIQSEKLVAIGELVAGVAHELNNPLTSVLLYAQLMTQENLEAHLAEDINQIVTQARRASHIVRRLLDFARQRAPERSEVMVNDIVRSTVTLLTYELRTRHVEMLLQLTPNLPAITADPQQLQQVFINLINNALQALEGQDNGQLSIMTRWGDSQFDPLLDQDVNEVVHVVIQDNGPGIPLEIQSRIFDPFFTTKPAGQGTGLGLSLCHSIINEHGGHIWVESTQNQGATFFIELPVNMPGNTN